MRFYDVLQMNPKDLKRTIINADTPEFRRKVKLARWVRALLLVTFCILLITPIVTLFGQENSPVAVALICILLALRFVDFGYCVEDSLINLGIVFAILVAGPAFATLVNPVLGILIHFASIFVILLMTTEEPEMGNGGLYAFSYVFIVGNPVTGNLLVKRTVLMMCGYIVCASIFMFKHYGKHSHVKFKDVAKMFHLTKEKNQWQLQLALGVSLFLGIGTLLGMERMMWGGFACASLLGCYSSFAGTKERWSDRILGVITGSVLFAIISSIVPAEYHYTFGPVGGIVLGFCSNYRHQTVLNCFGALLVSTALYGLSGSVMLRIVNNFIGATFGYCFFVGYQYIMQKHFGKTAEIAE